MKYPALSIFADIKWDLAVFFGIAAMFYVLASVYGATYFHPDQHFQTLEWADFKRHGTNEANLPWEYHRAIRPWLQPYLYVLFLNFADAIGITNPVTQDMALRLVSGAIGMLALILLSGAVAWWLPLRGQRRMLIALLALTALFPYLMTRTSSEATSAICIVFAFTSLFLLRKIPVAPQQGQSLPLPFSGKMEFSIPGLLLAGIATALAFNFRYQSGPVFVVLAAWMLFGARTPLPKIGLFILAIFVTAAMCFWLDIIGYGRWTFAPWNNVHANIIDGVAAKFGVSPWYFYFFVLSSNPIGAALVVSLILYIARFPLNLLSLFVGFYFLQHTLIGHKEARFLFPLIPMVVCMVPFLFSSRWFGADGTKVPFFHGSLAVRTVGITAIVVNAVGLYIICFPKIAPAVKMQQFIVAEYGDRFEYYALGDTPYLGFQDVFGDYRLRMEFYKPAVEINHDVAAISDLSELSANGAIVFFYGRNSVPETTEWDNFHSHCTMIFQSFDPNNLWWWSRPIAEENMQYSLYRCHF